MYFQKPGRNSEKPGRNSKNLGKISKKPMATMIIVVDFLLLKNLLYMQLELNLKLFSTFKQGQFKQLKINLRNIFKDIHLS